jgi:hypothetical protein
LKQVNIRISVTLARARQIGAAAAAARAQSVAESAVDAKFEFTSFRRLGVR